MIGNFFYHTAYAKIPLLVSNTAGLYGRMDIGGALFFLPNSNFSAGSYTIHPSGQTTKHKNVFYGELYMAPHLIGSWITPWGFRAFGTLSAVGSGTFGQGDAEVISQTPGTPHAITLEEANIGAEIPLSEDKITQKLSVEGGRQRFIIDDGFLVGKGTYSAGALGAWWYAPRFAFAGPGRISFEDRFLRSDIFILENNSNNDATFDYDQPKTKFEGFDISWFQTDAKNGETYEDRKAYITLSYIHVRQADHSAHYNYSIRANRQGMHVLSLSWGGSVFASDLWAPSKDFTFFGNVVAEENAKGHNGYEGTEAYGFYAEPGFTFSDILWEPHLFYRYTHLGGAKNQEGSVKRNYDPFFLFNGSRSNYGGYWPGEIVGMYLAPLSNIAIHQIDLTATPPWHLLHNQDKLTFGLHFYSLSLIHPGGLGFAAESPKHISDEIDLSAEYVFDPSFSGALTGGIASSGSAASRLVNSSLPQGVKPIHISHYSGIIEMFFYKSF
ncbi:hypothetical protein [Entomobacter blattae]|uniref:hypothetical protein n=1 Tax=Entomobacter blattae TaxID=2762277 RepID=UPI001EEF86F9|nr:hypothetical protein [Entomobacter blattae]